MVKFADSALALTAHPSADHHHWNSTRLVGNFASGTAQVDNGVLNRRPNGMFPTWLSLFCPRPPTTTVKPPAGASATTGTVVMVGAAPGDHLLHLQSADTAPGGGRQPGPAPARLRQDGSGYISGVGLVVSGNSYTVNPIETTTYTLTVTNPAGDAVTRILTVHVVDAAISRASPPHPSTITAGDFSQLFYGFLRRQRAWRPGPASAPGGVPITSGVSLFVNPAVTTDVPDRDQFGHGVRQPLGDGPGGWWRSQRADAHFLGEPDHRRTAPPTSSARSPHRAVHHLGHMTPEVGAVITCVS